MGGHKSIVTCTGVQTVKDKSHVEDMRKKGVIYRFLLECMKYYIGEMGRDLQKWPTEHKVVVNRGDWTNRIAVHV